MLEAIRRAISFLRQKQILHKLGVVVSITVIGIACYVLYHMLRGIDSGEVLDAIRGTAPRQIVLAALFVAAGYFTLTFYDWFAVRAIGRSDVPYRVNALAAFTSYSIGHNVGASVFTGGAVRYRIYSAWGLSAIDVAKICFLAGLTFWLGNAAVLGMGIAYHPEAAASIGQLCVKDECEKFVGRTGAIGLDVMTSGFDQILFRPASEIADDDKVKVVGRVRDLLTQEAANYLRDLQSRWPKDGSVRVKQAIDQAVTATAGIK